MTSASSMTSVLLSILIVSAAVCGTYAQLSVDFYKYSCPNLKTIVKEVVDHLPRKDNIGGALLRLAFHDCWVNGCEGSVLIRSNATNRAERDGFTNFKLRGIDEIDLIKTAVEKACPGIVSCADIIALAARAAVVELFGPSWDVVLGRRDGRSSFAVDAETNLPFPNANFDQLVANFATKGFNTREMIVLSGSHTIGIAHCNSVQPHLYNFTGRDDLTDVDPTLRQSFVDDLRQKCPKGNTDNVIPEMDHTGGFFDNNYYDGLLDHEGLFTSDAALITNSLGLSTVQELRFYQYRWFTEFAAAMLKMSKIGVLTGTQGEIRRSCQFVN